MGNTRNYLSLVVNCLPFLTGAGTRASRTASGWTMLEPDSSKTDQEVKLLEIQVGLYVDPAVLEDFPRSLAEEFHVVPLRRLGKGLLLGSAGEVPALATRDLTARLAKPICIIPCHMPPLASVLDQLYGRSHAARRIGEILRDDQALAEPELARALARQQEAPRRLGEILVELGLVSQHELAQGLTSQARERSPAISSATFADPKAVERLPESLARRHRILPLTLSAGEMVVAAEAVFDDTVLAELQSVTGLRVRRVLVGPGEVLEALERVYGRFRKTRLKELRIGELLVEEGLLNQAQLEVCLQDQKTSRKKLGQIVVERGFVTEDAVYQTLAAKLNVRFRRFSTAEIDLELGPFLSPRFAEQNHVLMLSKDDRTKQIEVAMADPADLNLQDILQGIVSHHGYRIKPVLSPPSCIDAGIVFTYAGHEAAALDHPLEAVPAGHESEDLNATDRMPEIKRIINQMLLTAVTEGASDIHLENLENAVHVRFRVDGVLEDRKTPIAKENIANVISVLKVDSGLDIAERRRSQDGVFKKRVGRDRFIDFRINVHATPFGEDAVIRILDRQKNLMPLDKLGFSEATLETYLRLISNPQGLILFTGPTGSGKTTTLYSTLTYLNTGNRKIVTAEDPIEYVLGGISQYQVNEAIGNTFDDYARRFLRKDPDIILIGEIRDSKTARACINAAMTGHLVFSTLHTNDSFGVVRRLFNLEVPAASVADSLLLVVSQRLARRICSQCQEPGEPDPKLVRDFFPRGVPEGIRFKTAPGCPACRFKGYRGRVGLYEFWEVNNQTRRLIASGASEEDIRNVAVKEGAHVLLQDAIIKVAAGATTLDELSRVVPIDQLQRYAQLAGA